MKEAIKGLLLLFIVAALFGAITAFPMEYAISQFFNREIEYLPTWLFCSSFFYLISAANHASKTFGR